MQIERRTISHGDFGAFETAQAMASLINKGSVSPLVRRQALQIVASVDGRNQREQASRLRTWLHAHFRFVRDPAGAELLHAPDLLLQDLARQGYVQGDCDDAAILGAALAKSIGFRTRLVIVGFHEATAPLSHVWTEIGDVAGKWWYELDITRSRPDLEGHISRRKVVPV